MKLGQNHKNTNKNLDNNTEEIGKDMLKENW
jgi:hypothetical protein